MGTQKIPLSVRTCYGRYPEMHNQLIERSGYFSDVELWTKKELGRRAVSVPSNKREIEKPGYKLINRVYPKLKENFGSGKTLKWGDFSNQKTRKMIENSNLYALDHTSENGQVSNKPNTWKVYTRNYQRKLRGGKTITNASCSSRKHEDVVLGVCEVSEGELGFKGSSTSDDDSSSEEFAITSDSEFEEEKELQEEAAFEGVRCLLGEGRKEFEEERGKEDIQVPNQPNHNGSANNHSGKESERFLSILSIELIKADNRTGCEHRDEGASFTKRSGLRELRNLVSNVNYEKGKKGKGETRYQ